MKTNDELLYNLSFVQFEVW